MARGYTQSDRGRSFVMKDEEHYASLPKSCLNLPSVRGKVWYMASEDNRDFLSEVIAAGRRAFNMKPVRSNEELVQRIQEYFSIAQGRRVPPTMEEFGLYLGYSSRDVLAWANGSNPGFADTETYGTTMQISTRAIDILHNADAVQAMRRISDPSTYIFRSKNYYDMHDTAPAQLQITFATPEALPPDQIAKMLPELVPDRSTDDVEII